MGYLPQFVAGDATQLGKSLVTATPTQAAARDLIGLGDTDSLSFARLGIGEPPTTRRLTVSTSSNEDGILLKRNSTATGEHTSLLFAASTLPVPKGGIYFQRTTTNGRGSLHLATTDAVDPETGVTIADAKLTITRQGNVDITGNLTLRNGTTATELLLAKTYTSDTNYEGLRATASGLSFRIGSAIGSAGGSTREIALGSWNETGTWNPSLRITSAGNCIIGEGANTLHLSLQNVVRWQMSLTSFFPVTDATYDIGSDSRRLRDIFVGRNLNLTGLATTDPGAAGRAWNNGNVLSLSGTTSPTFGTLTTGSGGDTINPVLRIGSGSDGVYRPQGGQLRFTMGGVNSFLLQGTAVSLLGVPLRIANSSNGNPVFLHNGGIDVLEQRNDTAGQIFRLHKTYTSGSNREYLQIDTTADVYRIGSAVGSAGGTHRNLYFGRWMADGSFDTRLYLTGGLAYFSRSVTSGIADLLKLECRDLADGTLRGVSLTGIFRGTNNQEKLAGKISFNQTSSFLNNDLTNAAIDFSVVRQSVESMRMRLSSLGNLDLMNAAGTRTIRLRGEDGGAEISGAVMLTNLPTSDPAVAGRLWNDNGTLKISA